MSYIAAGGNIIACPSLIGNTAGSAGPPGPLEGYFNQEFFTGQYWNAHFFNRLGHATAPANYFRSQYWLAQFFKSNFFGP